MLFTAQIIAPWPTGRRRFNAQLAGRLTNAAKASPPLHSPGPSVRWIHGEPEKLHDRTHAKSKARSSPGRPQRSTHCLPTGLCPRRRAQRAPLPGAGRLHLFYGLPGTLGRDRALFVLAARSGARSPPNSRLANGVIGAFRCVRSARYMKDDLLPVYVTDPQHIASPLLALVSYEEHERFEGLPVSTVEPYDRLPRNRRDRSSRWRRRQADHGATA